MGAEPREEAAVSVLLWWLIPLAATMLALLFVGLRSRPSKPVDAEQGMADLERFRQAMSRPMPSKGRGPGAGREPGASDDVFDQSAPADGGLGAADADDPSGRSQHRRSA
jgi:hypothetical protein